MKLDLQKLEGLLYNGQNLDNSPLEEQKLLVAVGTQVFSIDQFRGKPTYSVIAIRGAPINHLAAEADKIYLAFENKIFEYFVARGKINNGKVLEAKGKINSLAVQNAFMYYTTIEGVGVHKKNHAQVLLKLDFVSSKVTALTKDKLRRNTSNPYNCVIYSDQDNALKFMTSPEDESIELTTPELGFNDIVIHKNGIYLWKPTTGTLLTYDHLTGDVETAAQRELGEDRHFHSAGDRLYDGGNDGKIYSTLDDFLGEKPIFDLGKPINGIASLPKRQWQRFVELGLKVVKV